MNRQPRELPGAAKVVVLALFLEVAPTGTKTSANTGPMHKLRLSHLVGPKLSFEPDESLAAHNAPPNAEIDLTTHSVSGNR
jgi:hypothetical protein